MNCTNCQREINANGQFCPYCGQATVQPPADGPSPADGLPPTVFDEFPATMIEDGDSPIPVDNLPELAPDYPATTIEPSEPDFPATTIEPSEPLYPPTTIEPSGPEGAGGKKGMFQTVVEESGWRLAIIQGVGTGQSFALGLQTKLGRDPHSDVPLVDAKASRQHALIQRRDDGFVIIDQMSRNGTFVNGALVTGPTRLEIGHTVTIGNVKLIVQGQAENCSRCGTPLLQGDVFCRSCGQSVSAAAGAATAAVAAPAPPAVLPATDVVARPAAATDAHTKPDPVAPLPAPVFQAPAAPVHKPPPAQPLPQAQPAPPPKARRPKKRSSFLGFLRLVARLALVAVVGAGLGLMALYGMYYFGYLF